ncbi:MAG: cobalamin-dependent protein [Methanomassiliicoccaceae archaeon]|nr:cobalamin-dependent protein [Methanomassiliicoccaceae archaeon]
MLSTKGVNFDWIKRYDIEAENQNTPESIAKKMLPSDPVFKACAEDVLYMRFKDIGKTVTDALKSKKPLEVINDGLVAGMEVVSKLYAEHIYYLPEIMLGAKTMEIGIALAEKQLQGGRKTKGVAVMHVAEGDPHDIGKNIAAIMMRAAGFTVIDLGRDVPVDTVVDVVAKEKPFLVTGTALMTTTMSVFPIIAGKMKAKGITIPFMSAGGAVNREFSEGFELGIYSEKAPQTPPIADKIVAGYDWKKVKAEWDNIVKGV